MSEPNDFAPGYILFRVSIPKGKAGPPPREIWAPDENTAKVKYLDLCGVLQLPHELKVEKIRSN